MIVVLLERLVVSCRRMLSVEDRAAIMAGLEAGLSQLRITRSIGPSPSVVCREIARHWGPNGAYHAQDAGRAVQVAKRRPRSGSWTAMSFFAAARSLICRRGARPARSADA